MIRDYVGPLDRQWVVVAKLPLQAEAVFYLNEWRRMQKGRKRTTRLLRSLAGPRACVQREAGERPRELSALNTRGMVVPEQLKNSRVAAWSQRQRRIR